VSWTVSDGRIRTSAPITPTRQLPGGSAPPGVLNTAVTRCRMECHSRRGKDQSARTNPQKKKSNEKNPEGRSCLGRGPKFPYGELRSSYVLNLGLRLRPVMNRRACGCGARMQVKYWFHFRLGTEKGFLLPQYWFHLCSGAGL